ncbi:helix-turn-helix domain-containing protein [Caenispirillum salinarum]|uniref:helix-turn-helix domain-containing protein n=1 Tax=Caenispirillum salinarum TaxID=859058 RepID=UPI003850A351
MRKLLTVKGCADELQVSTKTIYRAVWSGALVAHRVAGRLRISPAALEAYLQDRQTGSGPTGGDRV